MKKVSLSNNFILHPRFKERVKAIQNEVELPLVSLPLALDNDDQLRHAHGNLTIIGGLNRVHLDAHKGEEHFNEFTYLAYDESIDKFQALEGSGYLTCHSIILLDDNDYLASNCLSFAFYTRSRTLLAKNRTLRDARNDKTDKSVADEDGDSIESAFKRDYANERTQFILNNCPSNTVLLIDGPLIGNQMSDYTVELSQRLLNKSVIPIHVVKNSSSNLVTDNIQKLNGNFNSDMHWAFKYLSPGERTNFFLYQDPNNKNFAKVFCYIKPFEIAPQRVEMHPTTYQGRESLIENLMDTLYFFFIAQGNLKNPQVRPVAIAEMFARESKKMYNINKILRDAKIQPTMNQTRGFG
ncbi:DNA double-strand break repair nuclease NurA [Methanoculleus sp.]|uniref:DNA double-strand break repair nuclease NurA n=1 Tax=Methanoculleus sp. TaxID=90427 RepID=UPI001BD49DC9|nr:DNA double-strand break repair nuclease NurA [Methanoculleus sp.]